MRYEQARADFERLVEIHNGEYPYDWDEWEDGFYFRNWGMELMQNPTKAKASQIYRAAIEYSSHKGFSYFEENDIGGIKRIDEVKKIYRKHGVNISKEIVEWDEKEYQRRIS